MRSANLALSELRIASFTVRKATFISLPPSCLGFPFLHLVHARGRKQTEADGVTQNALPWE